MIAPVSGGITVKVLTGRTAASLQRYRDSLDDGKEAPLFTGTRHCSHEAEAQVREWKAVRERHGTQGARRAPRAAYETVDPDTGIHASGRRGTHVKLHDGRRWRKRPVRDGETPTHLRVDDNDRAIKESEAVHTIYAAGADLVNPDNPEDIERFWAAVNAERDEHYPGLQESRWLERNGHSGLVHVHVASNATIYREFAHHGHEYRAGRKMAGSLTRVHDVRARFEKFLDAHPEHGLTQSLARVSSPEYQDAQRRDAQRSYWEQARGKESNQDRIRRTVSEVLSLTGVTDRDTFLAKMAQHDVEVREVGLRRGKPTKNHDYTYKLAGTKQAVRGKTLGAPHTLAAIDLDLARRAPDRRARSAPAGQRVGRARPLPFARAVLTLDDRIGIRRLRNAVTAMAHTETRRQRDEQPPTSAHSGPPHADSVQTFLDWLNSDAFTSEFEGLRTSPTSTSTPDAELHKSSAELPSRPRRRFVSRPKAATSGAPSSDSSVESAKNPGDGASFRSRLRTMQVDNPDAQKALEQWVEFEERAVDRLARGERLDEQHLQQVPINASFVERFGPLIEPSVREQLEMRVAKVAAYSQEHKQIYTPLTKRWQRLAQVGEQHEPTMWRYGREAQDVKRDLDISRRRLKRIRGEINAGIYEDTATDTESRSGQSQEPNGARALCDAVQTELGELEVR